MTCRDGSLTGARRVGLSPSHPSAPVPGDEALQVAEAGEELDAAALFAAGERGVALAAVEGGDDIEHVGDCGLAAGGGPAEEPQPERVREGEHPQAFDDRPAAAIAEHIAPRDGGRFDE